MWKNLHSTAKKEFSEFKRESKKTRGGPPPKPPSVSCKEIIEVFEDTLGFSGLNGLETGMQTIRLLLGYETCHVIIVAHSRPAMFFFFRVVCVI